MISLKYAAATRQSQAQDALPTRIVALQAEIARLEVTAAGRIAYTNLISHVLFNGRNVGILASFTSVLASQSSRWQKLAELDMTNSGKGRGCKKEADQYLDGMPTTNPHLLF